MKLILLLIAWHGVSANADWFSRQHNARGEYCCDRSDGHPYYDSYTINKDGSVTLANGHNIQAYKVLTGPNPTGHAIWWHTDGTDPVDYCFSPGSLI